jgi:flagellar biosynthesis protein FliR
VFEVDALLAAGLVAGRISGLLFSMPALGMQGVPPVVRILLSVLLTVVISGSLPIIVVPRTITSLVFGMASEVMLGATVGLSLRMAFGALSSAGELISSQIGQGSALGYDPVQLTAQSPMSSLATMLATAVFLGTDLHLQALVALGQSFSEVPPGGVSDLYAGFEHWVLIPTVVLNTAIRLAGPVLALVFLIKIFIAVLSRLSPSMNVFFSLAMILTIGAGQILLWFGLSSMLQASNELVESVVREVPQLIRRMGGG